MALLNILTIPDPRLHLVAKPVTEIDSTILTLIDDMLETMYDAPGIGLAATQVDVQLRVVVIDLSEEKNHPLVLINPEITHRDGHIVYEEGCLSVPGIYEGVERAERVTVTALDRAGEALQIEADELLAICIQHEIDHLDGKVFIDHLSPLKRQRIRKKLEKIKKQQM